jgi:hypothetical protein
MTLLGMSRCRVGTRRSGAPAAWPGDDLQEVAVVAQEVHAAAAVVTGDLAGVVLTGIGPVLGAAEVGILKLRTGSFFPELLEPRRRVDRALRAVIMTAYITGTSTSKVDDLVKALGCDSGISKSTVSRICAQIGDDDVHVLRTRRLDHQPFVYVWLDATYVHVREHPPRRVQGRRDRYRPTR